MHGLVTSKSKLVMSPLCFLLVSVLSKSREPLGQSSARIKIPSRFCSVSLKFSRLCHEPETDKAFDEQSLRVLEARLVQFQAFSSFLEKFISEIDEKTGAVAHFLLQLEVLFYSDTI